GRKCACDDRLIRIPKYDQQAIPIADLWRHIAADHCRGLCGKLRDHLRDLHEPGEVDSHCWTGLLGVGIENVQTRRARIEMDVVSAVMNGWLAQAIIEVEVARHELEQATSESFRDASDSISYRDPCRAQEFFDVRRNPNARVADELESLTENAFHQRF